MPPIDLPFSKVLLRLEGGAWTPLSRSNAERLRDENTSGLYEVQVRRFAPRSYRWEPLTSDYEHRARAAFRARKVGEEPKPAEEVRLLRGCAECGKTSTSDSMWALYCVACIEEKIAPALAAPVEPLPEAQEAPGTVKIPGYGYVDLRAVRAIEAVLNERKST